MTYVLFYFPIGFLIAVLLATINMLRGTEEPNFSYRRIMTIKAFVLVALAWPFSIAVFVYGACKQLFSELTQIRKEMKKVLIPASSPRK